jgi:hypothetical protein
MDMCVQHTSFQPLKAESAAKYREDNCSLGT